MGFKSWQKVGAVFLGSMLLYGCQDPPLRNNGLSKVPPPQFPTTPTTPANASTGAWGQPTGGFRTGTPASSGLSPAGTPSNLSGPSSLQNAPFSSGSGIYNTAPPSSPGSTGPSNAFPAAIQPPSNPSPFASPPTSSSLPTNFGTGASSPSFPPVSGPGTPGLPSPGLGTPGTPAPLSPALGGTNP
jgi:hypothetical protein